MTVELHDVLRGDDATRRLGAAVGQLLRGGDCVALSGQLGAGKTTFVQGVAAGLGIPPSEPVVSPTFVLVREYTGQYRMYHIDAYRLSGPDETGTIGLEDMLNDAGGVTLIEWAERIEPALPRDLWRIRLEHVDADHRAVWLSAPDAARQAALAQVIATMTAG